MSTTPSEQLKEITKDHHVFILPKDHHLYKDFGKKLMDFESWGITCSFGDVPELSDETHAAVYFPMKFDSPEMYDDPDNDVEMKNETMIFFEQIKSFGKQYLGS